MLRITRYHAEQAHYPCFSMQGSKDFIRETEAKTLHGVLRERVRRTPDAEAYRQFDRQTKRWQSITWREFSALTARWQSGLLREGLKVGDRVALSLRNGIEWVAFEQAALALGVVVVPLYTDDRPDNVAYILEQTNAALFLVQDGLRWRRLSAACDELTDLRRVVVLDAEAEDPFDNDCVVAASKWLPEGHSEWQQRVSDPNGLATIVYTSGTTGRPKGVMLSHHNILSVVDAGLQVVDIHAGDLFLSFLPLSHMLERAAGYYLPMAGGATIAYARSIATLADDLVQQRPTHLVAVPRIFERIYGRLLDQLEHAPAWRRAIFDSAVAIGWQRFEYQQRRAHWSPLFLLWPLFDRLVAKRVRDRLGGCLRIVASGGAPLPLSIARVFVGLGVPIIQGYGLTETSPQVSVNHLDFNDPASVGPALPGTEVSIGDQDELLVRGPGVMLGYWKNPDATNAMIRDGWLHTGDQAKIKGGRIYITGRIKDVMVLSNGEKVPPAEMESAIALDPLMEQVMIVGEGRAFLSALVVLNVDRWKALAQQLHLDPDDAASLTDKHLHHEIVHRIAQLLHGFPTWAKVRRVHLTLEPWTVENGLLTPTLKMKRGVILTRYADEIEHLYHQSHHDC